MKNILFVAALTLFACTAKGQLATPPTTQVVKAVVPNIITLSVPSISPSASYANATELVDGKEAGPSDLTVTSNKNWQLEMKADANFVEATTLGTMPIAGGLFKMKVALSSDYTVSTGFDNYTQVTTSNQVIISTGTKGIKTVTVNYKIAPGLTYPGGAYSNNVTYTATQL